MCCNTKCDCDRVIKTVDVNYNGTLYSIPINRTIKQIGCFYPIYIGDAVSTWRYERVNGELQYIRSFYKSVDVLIDFGNPDLVTEFVVGENNLQDDVFFRGVYAEGGPAKYYKLHWGDERFLINVPFRGTYKKKDFSFSLNGVSDDEISANLQTQVRQFGADNGFQELVDSVSYVRRTNLSPGTPIGPNIELESKVNFARPYKDRYKGYNFTAQILGPGNIDGLGKHEEYIIYRSIDSQTVSRMKYYSNILGLYIAVSYSNNVISTSISVNYLDSIDGPYSSDANTSFPRTIESSYDTFLFDTYFGFKVFTPGIGWHCANGSVEGTP
jgi:hypothetical protein